MVASVRRPFAVSDSGLIRASSASDVFSQFAALDQFADYAADARLLKVQEFGQLNRGHQAAGADLQDGMDGRWWIVGSPPVSLSMKPSSRTICREAARISSIIVRSGAVILTPV